MHQASSPLREAPSSPSAARWWLATLIASGALYIATMAPGVLWGDSGEAQVRVQCGTWFEPGDLARAHVTYYALAAALHRWIGLEAAPAANLVAAAAGALTVANVAFLAARFVRRRAAVAGSVCLLLLSHTLWQLSAGAEVVTSSTACLTLELIAVIEFLRTRDRKWLLAAALLNGLGLGTHNYALLTWPAYGLILLIKRRRIASLGWKTLAALPCLWTVGASPLLTLAVGELARSGSLTYAAGSALFGRYAPQVLGLHVSAGALVKLGGYLALNFPTPLLLAAIPGWWILRKRFRTAWIFLTAAAAGYLGFAIRYNVADQYTFMVHFYIFLILFTSVGLDRLLERHPSTSAAAATFLLCILALPLYLVVPPLLRKYAPDRLPLSRREIPYRDTYYWFLQPWRVGYHGAHRFAREALDTVPEHGVVLLDGALLSPVLYVQNAEGYRRDVQVNDGMRWQSWQPPNAPLTPDADLSPELMEFVAQGRVFAGAKDPPQAPSFATKAGWKFVPAGVLYRLEPGE